MAGRGPVPKAERVRRRDSPESRAVAESPAPRSTGVRRRLPNDLLPDGELWHPATLRWWNTWSKSLLTADLLDVDWCELEACAVLHHEYMRKRTFTLASELRIRMAKFGATPEDRMRLKITVAEPDVLPSPPPRAGGRGSAVTNIASRRSRLTS